MISAITKFLFDGVGTFSITFLSRFIGILKLFSVCFTCKSLYMYGNTYQRFRMDTCIFQLAVDKINVEERQQISPCWIWSQTVLVTDAGYELLFIRVEP